MRKHAKISPTGRTWCSSSELAKRLGISVAGVGYSVERGEIIARENDYQLIE
jgi:adenine/guanine phosphoribosyltransferase-like PRPP-binding protein